MTSDGSPSTMLLNFLQQHIVLIKFVTTHYFFLLRRECGKLTKLLCQLMFSGRNVGEHSFGPSWNPISIVDVVDIGGFIQHSAIQE